MRLSLELVVIAIVILVVALVVLTIFSGIIPRFGTLTDYENECRQVGSLSCQTGGTEPISWKQNVNVGGEITSCQQLLGTFTNGCCSKSGDIYVWSC